MFFKWKKGGKGSGKKAISFSLATYVDKNIPESFTSNEDALKNLKHLLNQGDYERIVMQIWDDFCNHKAYSKEKRTLNQFDPEDEAGAPLNFSKVSAKDLNEFLDLIASMFGIEGVYVIKMTPSHSLRMIAHNLDKYFNPFELNYKR